MSREAPLTPEPIKPPHWTDNWKAFHDNWDTILGIPTDPWEVVTKEDDSITSTYLGVINAIDTLAGHTTSDEAKEAERELAVYRQKIDKLVEEGPKTLGAAIDDLRKIYTDLRTNTNEGILLDIIALLLLPYLNSRIGANLKEKLQQDEDFYDADDYHFAHNLALAIVIKLGLDTFRDPKWG